MNTIKDEFKVPLTLKFSNAQKAILMEFMNDPGFDGKVGMPLPYNSVEQPDIVKIKAGLETYIRGEREIPFSLHRAVNRWLRPLCADENSNYLGTTTCHSTDQNCLKSALQLIAASGE